MTTEQTMSERLTVSTSRDGGFGAFPGLAQPFTVDASALPAADADRLNQLVAESGFFELPDPPGAAPVADGRMYTITVNKGEDRRTLSAPEPLSPPLRELVDVVEQYRRASR